MRAVALVPLLLRGRIRTGKGVIDLLSIVAFTVSGWLLLTVLAGVHLFVERQFNPPAAFVATVGQDAAESAAMWTVLAASAGVLLIVPVMTLGAAAARMGALGRDERLASLRLIGMTAGQATRLSTLETMAAAAIGTLAGLFLYLVTLPAWSAVTFQATPLSADAMLLPAWLIVAAVLLLIVLAGVSSLTGLMRLRISPLGVARRQPVPALRLWRLVAVAVLIAGWVVIGRTLNFRDDLYVSVSIMLVGLTLFMGVINVVGPWVMQLAGRLLAQSGRASWLVAGRRLQADAKGAWRSVAGLAFVGFTGGAIVALPDISSNATEPLFRVLGDDLRTGIYLTLAIAFVVAAASTLLNQACSLLDRRRELRQLSNLGVPERLHDDVRLVQVVLPAALSAFGSGGLALLFFGAIRSGSSISGLVIFGFALIAGVALVWAAGEACRPLLRTALRERTAEV